MIACIVGNFQTGLLNHTLMRELQMSRRSEVAYKRLLWNTDYHSLRYHAKMALVYTCKLIYLHKVFLQNYSEAVHLKPLEVTFYAPVKKNCLIPLVKVHYRIATLLEDKFVLSRDEYLAKLGLYLGLKKHLKHVTYYTKRKHNSEVSDAQGQIVKSLWEREMKDVGSKLKYVVGIRNILQVSGVVSASVQTLKKAQTLKKLTEYIGSKAIGLKPNPSTLQRIINHPRPQEVNIYDIMLENSLVKSRIVQEARSALRKRTGVIKLLL